MPKNITAFIYVALSAFAFSLSAEQPADPPRRTQTYAQPPCVVAFTEPAHAGLPLDPAPEIAVDSRFDSQFYGSQFFDETPSENSSNDAYSSDLY